jgi:guanylate kinase
MGGRGGHGSDTDSSGHRARGTALVHEAAGDARLTVLSGPSGVGKGTVVAGLRKKRPDIWLSVSVTTRSPRPGEVDGREYHFVSEEAFDRMIARGELLEWAAFAGHRYGTPREPVAQRLASGVPVLLEIDIEGARQVRRAVPDALLVFLAPPSWDELVRRLSGRGTEPPEVIARRLELAASEIEAGKEFDITLVNTSVEDVCGQLVALMTASSGHDTIDGR